MRSLLPCSLRVGRGDQFCERLPATRARGPHGGRRPLLARAGPRAHQLARGFREDAFSYLLFLRLVPAVPFFLVNLAPASPVCGLGRSTPRPRSVLSREPSSSLLRRSGWTA